MRSCCNGGKIDGENIIKIKHNETRVRLMKLKYNDTRVRLRKIKHNQSQT